MFCYLWQVGLEVTCDIIDARDVADTAALRRTFHSLPAIIMSGLLSYLSAAYREVIEFQPLSDADSPRTRHNVGQVITKANTIIGQMYAHIQGISAGSVVEEEEQEMELDDGRGSWGRKHIYFREDDLQWTLRGFV